MKKFNGTSSFQIQLSFDFEPEVASEVVSPTVLPNVIHVQFGLKKLLTKQKTHEDAALLERVLLSAQKLKW